MGLAILVGTRKGLFILRGDEDRRTWQVEDPLLAGWDIFHAIKHEDDLYVAANNFVYGATVQRSSDRGKTWERSEPLELPEGSELTIEKAWHVEPGSDGTFWLGGAPGVLFRSNDKGATWEPVRSLIEHPTRERWNPGAGGMCTHSIQFDPENEQRMYVAISAAGVFRSDDGGETWTPKNKGTAADFMPDDPFPEVGQCVHKLLVHPTKPERLWQQNHCGVYRSDDRGDNWERLEDNGLPTGFGFPIALHPTDPDVAYVVPNGDGENRVTADGRLGVYKTTDGGQSWKLASKGLPEQAWAVVLRENMAYDSLDPSGVYLGTQSGSVFVSPNEGEEWIEAASQLPPILSIEVAEWQ
jgi:photosystem II stability/assembly factor-like uncharacterized protein